MFLSCDPVWSLICVWSVLAFSCFCVVSLHTTRCRCSRRARGFNLRAGNSSARLLWGTSSLHRIFHVSHNRDFQSRCVVFLCLRRQVSLPPGWGLYDGLLSLLLHHLYEVRQRPKCDLKTTNRFSQTTPSSAVCVTPAPLTDCSVEVVWILGSLWICGEKLLRLLEAQQQMSTSFQQMVKTQIR